MAYILSLETSGKFCSAAVHKNGNEICSIELSIPQSHASQMGMLISRLLNVSEVKPAELNAITVSAGPGSYTGLRIGVSTAKGMCMALDIPLISINTLDLLAYQVKKELVIEADVYCPMLDARRMEVYCKIFNAELMEVSPMESMVIDKHSFEKWLQSGKVIFFGDGADKSKDEIIHANAVFVDKVYPLASSMGVMALQKYMNNETEDLMLFEPFYAKEFSGRKQILDTSS